MFDYQAQINPITAFNPVQFTEQLGFANWDKYMTDLTFTVRKDCITDLYLTYSCLEQIKKDQGKKFRA